MREFFRGVVRGVFSRPVETISPAKIEPIDQLTAFMAEFSQNFPSVVFDPPTIGPLGISYRISSPQAGVNVGNSALNTHEGVRGAIAWINSFVDDGVIPRPKKNDVKATSAPTEKAPEASRSRAIGWRSGWQRHRTRALAAE